MATLIRTLALTACAAALAVGAAACGGDDNGGGSGGGGGGDDSGPIKVGMVAALSGQYAPVGGGNRAGAEAAVKELNDNGGIDGRQIELEVLDAGTDPSSAVRQTQKLLDDDSIVAMIGVGFGSGAAAAAPRANQAKMPYLSMSAASIQFDPVQPYVYGIAPTFAANNESTAKFLKGEGVTKIALLHDNSEAAVDGAGSAKTYAEQEGLEIVADETFGLDATTLAPSLTKIKNSGADAIWLFNVTPQAVTATKEWKQLKLPQRLVLTAGNATPLFMEPACPSANGALIASTLSPIWEQLPDGSPTKEVAAAANAAIGPDASVFSYNGYGAVKVIQAAIEKAGSATRESIASALEDIVVVTPDSVNHYTPESHAGPGASSIIVEEVQDCELKILPGQDLSPNADLVE